jgi:hypothetical protein
MRREGDKLAVNEDMPLPFDLPQKHAEAFVVLHGAVHLDPTQIVLSE